ncbi:MAG: tryptophan-rich sensory protein [Anaerolineales bacterium]|nr:tryptophan-rich sensory protein [Anaerolineales bacterium]MCO5246872.1 tryptophan-rich sensory protein [Anaerolineae bacterium]
MNRDTIRQIAVILATLATVTINGLANALPINGQNTGQISDRFDVLFVPAGYVFAIWGLIYLGLIVYTVFQALPAQKENPRLRQIGWIYVLASIANSVWIFLWHYELLPLTLIAMLILLACLLVIYQRLGINRTPVSRGERWAVHVPFSIYLGWITVATIANVTDLLWSLGWNGFGLSAEAWFLIMLGATIIIAGLMAFTRGDVAYLLVLVWALAGIAVKHSDVQSLAMAAAVAAGIVVVFVIIGVVRRGSRPPVPAAAA